jgi:cobalt-zinc-cadmium efflux system outer membrane protein
VEIFRLAKRRNAAGAISDFEAAAPEVEALQVEADVARMTGDVEAAQARLLFLMGLPASETPLVASGEDIPPIEVPPADALVNEALSTRPDLIAAGLAMEAAAERVRLAKCQWITIDGIVDVNSRGLKGFEIGPGIRPTIPIFNGNQGNIAIAEAQYEMLARRYATIQNQIRQDVLTSHARLQQSLVTLNLVRNKLLPATKNASELARKNFEGGAADYSLTLQTLGQDLTAQVRQAELFAGVRRGIAELERSVGHHIDFPAAAEPTPLDMPPEPQSVKWDLPACRPVSHP